MVTRDEFLHPRSRYYGQVKPENLVFNANLQEFAQRVSYTASLETGGKVSAEEAYQNLKVLWQQFESASKRLKIADKSSPIYEKWEG